jgi:DNA-binding LacI/PurR family transcriptional regulator
MTVSNVLNGKNKENWPSTARRAAKIREIAEKMNYRPNAAAKAVVTGALRRHRSPQQLAKRQRITFPFDAASHSRRVDYT